MDDMNRLLEEIVNTIGLSLDRGKVASYIPELATVDINKFGIAVATVDGDIYSAGDATLPFSIQSISKVFTLTLALGRFGASIWKRVGREPSGNAFNSIIQLENEHGKPRNPFINAGAITIADLILSGNQPKESIAEILEFIRSIADDRSIVIDDKVAASEMLHSDRNASLAHFMASFGCLDNNVDCTLGVYFHHCSIVMNCLQLAKSGLYLAAYGRNPISNYQVISAKHACRINSLMLMCGHYDGSGEFAFKVGLPSKSGVGGGILAIVPGKASIAVWSPGLDKFGNSYLGSQALEVLSRELSWSIFGAA